MSDTVEWLLMYARQFEDQHAPENLTIGLRQAADELDSLYVRYDDAMKRIQDMQAELEYLRQEVNRG